jgi:hypothetical protein
MGHNQGRAAWKNAMPPPCFLKPPRQIVDSCTAAATTAMLRAAQNNGPRPEPARSRKTGQGRVRAAPRTKANHGVMVLFLTELLWRAHRAPHRLFPLRLKDWKKP